MGLWDEQGDNGPIDQSVCKVEWFWWGRVHIFLWLSCLQVSYIAKFRDICIYGTSSTFSLPWAINQRCTENKDRWSEIMSKNREHRLYMCYLIKRHSKDPMIFIIRSIRSTFQRYHRSGQPPTAESRKIIKNWSYCCPSRRVQGLPCRAAVASRYEVQGPSINDVRAEGGGRGEGFNGKVCNVGTTGGCVNSSSGPVQTRGRGSKGPKILRASIMDGPLPYPPTTSRLNSAQLPFKNKCSFSSSWNFSTRSPERPKTRGKGGHGMVYSFQFPRTWPWIWLRLYPLLTMYETLES